MSTSGTSSAILTRAHGEFWIHGKVTASQRKRPNGTDVLAAAGDCCFRLYRLEIVGPEALSVFDHGCSGD
jgi:hypothetical protein